MSSLAIVVLNAVLLTALWALYFYGFRGHALDRTRFMLFDIRDGLARRVAEGKIPPDSKAYRMTRTTLNGLIRHAHDMSFVRLIFTATASIGCDAYIKQYAAQRARAMKELDEEARQILQDARQQMHIAVLSHVYRMSLILRLIVLPIRVVLSVAHLWDKFAGGVISQVVHSRRSDRSWMRVDAEASAIARDTRLAT